MGAAVWPARTLLPLVGGERETEQRGRGSFGGRSTRPQGVKSEQAFRIPWNAERETEGASQGREDRTEEGETPLWWGNGSWVRAAPGTAAGRGSRADPAEPSLPTPTPRPSTNSLGKEVHGWERGGGERRGAGVAGEEEGTRSCPKTASREMTHPLPRGCWQTQDCRRPWGQVRCHLEGT